MKIEKEPKNTPLTSTAQVVWMRFFFFAKLMICNTKYVYLNLRDLAASVDIIHISYNRILLMHDSYKIGSFMSLRYVEVKPISSPDHPLQLILSCKES